MSNPLKIFSLDEEEETEVVKKPPKGAKISKNLGRDTQTSFSQKQYIAPSYNVGGSWITDAKQHPLHRPVDKYFTDKEEQQKKAEEETAKEKQIEKQKEKQRLDEVTSIISSIKKDLKKVQICLLCKRKFGSLDYYMKHLGTESHKRQQTESINP